MIVVDASVVLEVLLQTPSASSLTTRFLSRGVTLHAPHLLDVEIAQALRRYCLRGEITAERGAEALSDLADFTITRYPHDPFLPRVWELRANVSAYDAVYVALAEVLSAPLLTRDARLANSPDHGASIELQ